MGLFRPLTLLLLAPLVGAFQVPVRFNFPTGGRRATKLPLVPLTTEVSPGLTDTILGTATPAFSSILLAEESWRQYVPLGVSVLVIIDILLGSPAANSILGMARSSSKEEDAETSQTQRPVRTKGERVDTEQVANAALERARNALEWQKYKEETKSDEDRMEELRRKMDDQMRQFDNK